MYYISNVKSFLGSAAFSQKGLFVHKFSGCNSTSCIYNIRKIRFSKKKIKDDGVLYSCATALILPGKNITDTICFVATVQILLQLCTYDESHHSQIIRSSRTSTSNWVFYEMPLFKSILSDHDMDEYGYWKESHKLSLGIR